MRPSAHYRRNLEIAASVFRINRYPDTGRIIFQTIEMSREAESNEE